MILLVSTIVSKLFVSEVSEREVIIRRQLLKKKSGSRFVAKTSLGEKNNSELEKNSALDTSLGKTALENNSVKDKLYKKKVNQGINTKEFEPNQHQFFVKVERILSIGEEVTRKNSVSTMDPEKEGEEPTPNKTETNKTATNKSEKNKSDMSNIDASPNIPITEQLNQANDRVVKILSVTKNYNNRTDILALTKRNQEQVDGSLSPTLGEAALKLTYQEGMYY